MEPEEVVNLLNIYFDMQTEIVQSHGGDIDKFVGDELMAIFKGEGMADAAVNCAIAIQSGVQKLNSETGRGIGIGIGINTGPMVMGAMGSKARMDFTVIGDHVNLASRLCNSAKPGGILISEFTENILKSGNFNLTKLDPIKVKGKEKAVQVYGVEK